MSTEIIPGVHLRDPFMVAASHWTSTLKALSTLAPLKPAALTLKTTSEKHGGNLERAKKFQRTRYRLIDWTRRPFAGYTDGPRPLELWDTLTTHDMMVQARELFPETKLGISVLQGEDYGEIAASLDLNKCDYVELNLKYSLQEVDSWVVKAVLKEIKKDVQNFLKTFGEKPVFMKLSRETGPLLNTPEFKTILKFLADQNAGVIVANSRKIVVPPSRNPAKIPSELTDGVVVGGYLFMETYNMLRTLDRLRSSGEKIPSFVASGGVMDICSMLDSVAVGAVAVQLCSIFDLRGVRVLEWLRNQLSLLCDTYDSFAQLRAAVRKDEKEWSNVITKAREMPRNEIVLVSRALEDEQAVTKSVAEALKSECTGVMAKPRGTAVEGVEVPHELRFVVTKGNAAGFLLGMHTVEELDIEPVFFNFASDLCQALEKEGFSFDLAIVPESTFAFIEGESSSVPLDNLKPRRVGAVGKSIFELATTSQDLSAVLTVYHFGGRSANAARAKLLRDRCRPEFIKISWEKLVPLMQTWPEGSAILAKPPLSQMYGLLMEARMRERWKAVWTCEEDLLLIASKLLLNRTNGEKIALAVYESIGKQRKRILADPVRNARRARLFGFINYCSMLLGLRTEVIE